jgi:hypothetical protein
MKRLFLVLLAVFALVTPLAASASFEGGNGAPDLPPCYPGTANMVAYSGMTGGYFLCHYANDFVPRLSGPAWHWHYLG